jgi:hypothetical protein
MELGMYTVIKRFFFRLDSSIAARLNRGLLAGTEVVSFQAAYIRLLNATNLVEHVSRVTRPYLMRNDTSTADTLATDLEMLIATLRDTMQGTSSELNKALGISETPSRTSGQRAGQSAYRRPMTVERARKIVRAWIDAAQNGCTIKLSTVGVDSLSQIYDALLVNLAEVYQLRHKGRNQPPQEFADTLKWYDEGRVHIPRSFLPDDIYDSVLRHPRGRLDPQGTLTEVAIDYWKTSPEYQQLLQRERPSEFCEHLRKIGPDDDLYWHKVFKALGLPFP